MKGGDQGADTPSERQKKEKKGDKGVEYSERRRKQKEPREDAKEASERRKKKKDDTGADASERRRMKKDDLERGADASERRKKQKEDKEKDKGDVSERRKKQKDKDKGDTSERRKKEKRSSELLPGETRNKLTSPENSERRKKKSGTLRQRVKKFVDNLKTQERKEEGSGTKEKVIDKLAPTDEQKAAFEAFAKVVFEIGVEGLIGEYATLKPYLASTYSREIFDQNPTKNRYKDVICNDFTRVVIKDGKGSDYIHANYVRGNYLVNTFICTQGPILTTITDFWRMVLCERVSHIIMLCDTIEQGKMKCEQYWPNEQAEKMEIGDFVLTTVKVTSSDIHVIRSTIEIVVAGGQRHKVKHHRWRTWPDKTVPKSLLAVFRILQSVRNSSNPIVVHCSAGIGRTGSMVAIEMCLQTLLAGQKLNLLDVCRKLRDQRMHSVQVEVQYVYIAEAICEYGRAMGYWNHPELLSVSSERVF
ncbi:Tyrosine-protein phosphatase [Trichostrongylus colubriformis]|uniref:Tyrosine-protein phosphatase n=1 Tax=Trichostrongylus colubriformis TaxID=6319 RepID=A0AAN8F817_TRICO